MVLTINTNQQILMHPYNNLKLNLVKKQKQLQVTKCTSIAMDSEIQIQFQFKMTNLRKHNGTPNFELIL